MNHNHYPLSTIALTAALAAITSVLFFFSPASLILSKLPTAVMIVITMLVLFVLSISGIYSLFEEREITVNGEFLDCL